MPSVVPEHFFNNKAYTIIPFETNNPANKIFYEEYNTVVTASRVIIIDYHRLSWITDF